VPPETRNRLPCSSSLPRGLKKINYVNKLACDDGTVASLGVPGSLDPGTKKKLPEFRQFHGWNRLRSQPDPHVWTTPRMQEKK
jgi:hypothetical protein